MFKLFARFFVLSACLATAMSHAATLDTASRRVLFTHGTLGYNTVRIPALVVCSDGSLIVFAEGRKNSAADHGYVDTIMRRSIDGGKTWSDPKVILSDGKNSLGNPQPILDKKSGDIVLLYYWARAEDSESLIISGKSADRRRAFVVRSSDNGESWSKPVEITDDVLEKSMAWFVPGPGGGIQIDGGKYAGRLISAYDTSYLNPRSYRAGSAYSDDGGHTWKSGKLVDYDGANECQAAQLDNDTLLLNMRVEGRNPDRTRKTLYRIVSYSKDGGETWSNPVADPQLPEPICQGALISFKNPRELLAIRGERTLVFSNPADMQKRARLSVRFSDTKRYAKWLENPDAKMSPWDAPLLIDEGGASYSDMKILSDGRIALVYEAGKSKWPADDIVFVIIDPQLK